MAVAAFKGALSALHYFPELLFQNLTRFGPAKASWDMHARVGLCRLAGLLVAEELMRFVRGDAGSLRGATLFIQYSKSDQVEVAG